MTGVHTLQKGPALAPGFLFLTILLSACGEREAADAAGGDLCWSAPTAISEIQGEGYRSPLQGSHQLVIGAVTHIAADGGFYLESPGDGNAGKASRALFVEHHDPPRSLAVGQHVAVSGRVEEIGSQRDTMTSLARVDGFAVCESSLPLPLTPVHLPLNNREREALEGMRVVFAQDLVVSDVWSRYRGRITLSAESSLRVPTEDLPPGRRADAAEGDNRERSIDLVAENDSSLPLSAGARFPLRAGVLGHDGRAQLLLADEAGEPYVAAEPAVAPAPLPGSLRVVNANLLNYFNGDGRGGGFPAERGAETRRDFVRQQARLQAALAQLQPDLLAVQELENDGYGPYSAAQSLLGLLEQAGGGRYALIDRPEGRLGRDVISVGLFYRPDALEAVGPSRTLDTEPFRGLSRQPLAQLFRERSSGVVFLVAVNHLKSKGSCPDSGAGKDRGDGQGCWNRARVDAVDELLPWLREFADEAGTQHVLVLGDMNAYRMEDPIRAFRGGGFTELVETLDGLPQYSYRHFGRAGTLDYAFATPGLAALATRAFIWHINADWPRNMDLPEPWLRASDHDPVVVELHLATRP